MFNRLWDWRRVDSDCVTCKFYWQDLKACSFEPVTFLGHTIKIDCLNYFRKEEINDVNA